MYKYTSFKNQNEKSLYGKKKDIKKYLIFMITPPEVATIFFLIF